MFELTLIRTKQETEWGWKNVFLQKKKKKKRCCSQFDCVTPSSTFPAFSFAQHFQLNEPAANLVAVKLTQLKC